MTFSTATKFLLFSFSVALTACKAEDEWVAPLVVINELVASNATGLQDESGAYPDWFELYSHEDVEVDLSSYFVTDDLAQPQRWGFPAGTVIQPGEYLVVFADSDDSTITELHTNFRLERNGEVLALVGPATEDLPILDETSWEVQEEDVAWARLPDGSGSFGEDPTPTPGAANE